MPDRKALLVCPEAPYPMHGGGAFRTASVLHYLAGRFALDAVFFAEGGSADPAASLPSGICRRVLTLPLAPHSGSSAARAARNLRRLVRGVVPLCDRFDGHQETLDRWLQGEQYDLAVLEHFWLVSYQSVVKRHTRRVVLDLHNVESVLLERTAATASWTPSWALRRFAAIARRYEQSTLSGFDGLWVPSGTDAQTPAVREAGVPVFVYPNALPAVPLPQAVKDNTIAFSGNWSYPPNQSGLRWFLTQVWPALRARVPGLKLRLIGRNAESVQPLIGASQGVEFTGDVPDALPWIAKAAVAVAPLLAGSGTRLKILEAWAAQVPVVATSLAAEGLAACPGRDLLLEDSPDGFARAVLQLLQSPETAASVAQSGRKLFETSYSWPKAWESLAQAGF